MIRKIIQIDREKCNGCGLCVNACAEGALQLIDGKATLITDSYCDGLGACLPACPTDALKVIERESEAFDEEAVNIHLEKEKQEEIQKQQQSNPLPCGCPGTHARAIEHKPHNIKVTKAENLAYESQLRQWPCQIKLVPPNAPYFDGAHLLVAADCTAYAYANIHDKFMKNKITIIGCPKLDDGNYSEKLTQIIKNNDIKSVSVLRMEVPCCGGIENAVKQALINSGKMIPWNVTIIGTDGQIIE